MAAQRLIDVVYELRKKADSFEDDARYALRDKDVITCDWLRKQARGLREMADELHITCK